MMIDGINQLPAQTYFYQKDIFLLQSQKHTADIVLLFRIPIHIHVTSDPVGTVDMVKYL
jgi:hypothetical protein